MVPQRGVLSGESWVIRAWTSARAERLKSVDPMAVPDVSTSRNLQATVFPRLSGKCCAHIRAHTVLMCAG